MSQHRSPQPRTPRSAGWWVLSAWASLALLVAVGLAGAAGVR